MPNLHINLYKDTLIKAKQSHQPRYASLQVSIVAENSSHIRIAAAAIVHVYECDGEYAETAKLTKTHCRCADTKNVIANMQTKYNIEKADVVYKVHS